MKKYINNLLLLNDSIIFFITNYLSFGFQVLFGFLIFFIIYYNLGPIELGIFIQTYTIFVILGQISVLGINESILQKIASKTGEHNLNFFNGFLAVLFFSILFYIILTLSLPVILNLFQSADLLKANTYLTISIFIFSLNKFFFSYLIGKKDLNYFAFLNATRPLIILLVIFISIFNKFEMNYSLFFLFAEIFIFILAMIKIFNLKLFSFRSFNFSYIKNHYSFGIKVFFNSFLSESFIRTDILIIGIMLSDKMVGIYGVAALFFEGIYQFSVVLRNIINPDLGYLYARSQFSKIVFISQKYGLISAITISVISFFVYFIFDYILIFYSDPNLILSKEILRYLLIGLCIYSLIVPMENLLFLANKPLSQSSYMVTLSLINIFLNVILINKYGLLGAAIATSSVYSIAVILFNLFIIKSTQLRYGIFINK